MKVLVVGLGLCGGGGLGGGVGGKVGEGFWEHGWVGRVKGGRIRVEMGV